MSDTVDYRDAPCPVTRAGRRIREQTQQKIDEHGGALPGRVAEELIGQAFRAGVEAHADRMIPMIADMQSRLADAQARLRHG